MSLVESGSCLEDSDFNKEKTRVAKLFGYPGFWVVDMFDWLLVGLAAFD